MYVRVHDGKEWGEWSMFEEPKWYTVKDQVEETMKSLMESGKFEIRWDGHEVILTPIDREDDIMSDRYAPPVFYNPEDWAKEYWEDDIPWHEIPEIYNWAAMDSNGVWYGYQNQPQLVEGRVWWSTSGGGVIRLGDLGVTPNWTESLVQRPK